jgi:hypothetical protein
MKTPLPPPGAQRATTWAALLAAWTDFARASAAFPRTSAGDDARRAVPSLIGLQALTFAVTDIDHLSEDERAVGLDTAALLLKQYAGELHTIYTGQELSPLMQECVQDAQRALRAAQGAGIEFVVATDRLIADHPAELVDALLEEGFAGDLSIAAPGVPIFRSCPCAFMRGAQAFRRAALSEMIRAFVSGDTPAHVTHSARAFRQAYRQFDFARGGPVRDYVVPFDTALPAGQPLLVPAILAGKAQPVPLPIRGAADQAPLPVEFGEA